MVNANNLLMNAQKEIAVKIRQRTLAPVATAVRKNLNRENLNRENPKALRGTKKDKNQKRLMNVQEEIAVKHLLRALAPVATAVRKNQNRENPNLKDEGRKKAKNQKRLMNVQEEIAVKHLLRALAPVATAVRKNLNRENLNR